MVHDIKTEKAVLGALLVEGKSIIEVIDILHEKCFYDELHRTVFRHIAALHERREPIDIITVYHSTSKEKVPENALNAHFISSLAMDVASSAHIVHHARILVELYTKRKLAEITAKAKEESLQNFSDPFALIGEIDNELTQLSIQSTETDLQEFESAWHNYLLELEERQKTGLHGLPSGFTELDRITNGFEPSEVVVVAARPSMGKTALALNFGLNMAKDFGKKVAFFSLEMSKYQLIGRLAANMADINANELKGSAHVDWDSLTRTPSHFPLYIDDSPELSDRTLRAKLHRMQRRHGVDCAIVDYIQLMSCSKKTSVREQEVSHISRQLKLIAKELNIPIIVLSQLNRAIESRTGSKKPLLSDLRESGAIEQDADIVMFVHRPGFYGLTEDENGENLEGLAEIILRKNRGGETGEVQLRFDGSKQRFTDDFKPYTIDDGNF